MEETKAENFKSQSIVINFMMTLYCNFKVLTLQFVSSFFLMRYRVQNCEVLQRLFTQNDGKLLSFLLLHDTANSHTVIPYHQHPSTSELGNFRAHTMQLGHNSDRFLSSGARRGCTKG